MNFGHYNLTNQMSLFLETQQLCLYHAVRSVNLNLCDLLENLKQSCVVLNVLLYIGITCAINYCSHIFVSLNLW